MGDVTISVVGDILMRKGQTEAARREDGISFDYVFEQVAPHIQSTDLAIGNLETVFAGPSIEYARFRPYTRSMPWYNCPDELAETLRRTGFHALTTANNHCLDQGAAGACRTLDVLDQNGIHHTGTARSQAEAKRNLILEANGIRIGILAYSYSTNHMPVPKDAPWMVNLIGTDMLRRTKEMKAHADLVFVCLHAGVEFIDWPSASQRYWVNRLFHHGADAVLGSHPHVLQPMEVRTVRDMDGVKKQRFAIYSLGNFTATKMRDFKTLTGIILKLRAARRSPELVEIVGADYIPTWVEVKDRYRVVPIREQLVASKGQHKAELSQALSHVESVLAAPSARPRMLWEPHEVATITGGEWISEPNSTRWNPKRVRISEGENWKPNRVWNRDGIVFLRDTGELARIPETRAPGCLVIPKALVGENLPPRPATLAVDDVDSAFKAMAFHARARHRGKLALILGRRAQFLPELIESLSQRGSVATNVLKRRSLPIVTQFLASLPADTQFAVFELMVGRSEIKDALRLFQPDVLAFADPKGSSLLLGRRPYDLADILKAECTVILREDPQQGLMQHALGCRFVVTNDALENAIQRELN